MRRWTLNILAVLLLVLCLLTVAMWVRSYSMDDVLLQVSRPPGGYVVLSSHGYINLVATQAQRTLFVPYLFLIAFSAILPGVRLWQLSRLWRLPHPGHCHVCDYDLTGNVSGICPECGTPTPLAPSRISPPS